MLTLWDIALLGSFFLVQLFCEFLVIAWVFNRVLQARMSAILAEVKAQLLGDIRIDLIKPVKELMQNREFQDTIADIMDMASERAEEVASRMAEKYIPPGLKPGASGAGASINPLEMISGALFGRGDR